MCNLYYILPISVVALQQSYTKSEGLCQFNAYINDNILSQEQSPHLTSCVKKCI